MIPTPGRPLAGAGVDRAAGRLRGQTGLVPVAGRIFRGAGRQSVRYPAHVHQRRSGRGHGEKSDVWGPTGERIDTRQSVIDLWQAARNDLEAAGAEVVEVDFPVVSNYEGDRAGCPNIFTRGLVSPAFLDEELRGLSAWAYDDFLRANDDPALNRLADADGELIFPPEAGALPSREGDWPSAWRSMWRWPGPASPPGINCLNSKQACGVWSRPAGSTSRSGWMSSDWTRWSFRRSPTSVRPTPM